jgi:hypothetical protein
MTALGGLNGAGGGGRTQVLLYRFGMELEVLVQLSEALYVEVNVTVWHAGAASGPPNLVRPLNLLDTT